MGIISQNMGVNVASRIMVCSTVNRKSSKSLIEYYTLYTNVRKMLEFFRVSVQKSANDVEY